MKTPRDSANCSEIVPQVLYCLGSILPDVRQWYLRTTIFLVATTCVTFLLLDHLSDEGFQKVFMFQRRGLEKMRITQVENGNELKKRENTDMEIKATKRRPDKTGSYKKTNENKPDSDNNQVEIIVNEKTSISNNQDFLNSDIVFSNSSSFLWPLIVFSTIGRLGNCLNSYATALVFAWKQNATDAERQNSTDLSFVLRDDATIAVSQRIYEVITTLLDPKYLTLPVVGDYLRGEAGTDRWLETVTPKYATDDMVGYLKPSIQKAINEYHKTQKEKIVALEGYPNKLWLIASHHSMIHQNFQIRESLLQKAQSFLDRVKSTRKRKTDIVFVGVHIRRKDYVRYMKKYHRCSLPDDTYYEAALVYYRLRYTNPVFVICSNDMKHAKEHLSKYTDVVFSEFTRPSDDMALLASCSHSILTVGSYGYWGSFFAGGEVVYPLLRNCTHILPFLHPKNMGPLGYENWVPIEV